jgi:hypothetical protein
LVAHPGSKNCIGIDYLVTFLRMAKAGIGKSQEIFRQTTIIPLGKTE